MVIFDCYLPSIDKHQNKLNGTDCLDFVVFYKSKVSYKKEQCVKIEVYLLWFWVHMSCFVSGKREIANIQRERDHYVNWPRERENEF